MKTDRELLELAAKSVGYDTSHKWNSQRMDMEPPVIALCIPGVSTGWDPINESSHALRLLVKLREIYGPLLLAIFDDRVECGDESTKHAEISIKDGDIGAAVRRAITTHAAAIQISKEAA